MFLDKKTYKKLCQNCRKHIKRSITSPSPPPPKKHLSKPNKVTFDICRDPRVVTRKHFHKLLSKNKQGRTRKNVPWTKLSQTLVLQRQRLISWPVNFPFHDGIQILNLSTVECKELLAVKIKNWTAG